MCPWHKSFPKILDFLLFFSLLPCSQRHGLFPDVNYYISCLLSLVKYDLICKALPNSAELISSFKAPSRHLAHTSTHACYILHYHFIYISISPINFRLSSYKSTCLSLLKYYFAGGTSLLWLNAPVFSNLCPFLDVPIKCYSQVSAWFGSALWRLP